MDASPETECEGINLDADQKIHLHGGCSETFDDRDTHFSFPCGPSISEDDEELTESKITAFLDEKVLLTMSCRHCYETLLKASRTNSIVMFLNFGFLLNYFD